MQLKTFIILASVAFASAARVESDSVMTKTRARHDIFGKLSEADQVKFHNCAFQTCIKPKMEANKFSEECLELKKNCKSSEYRKEHDYENKKACKKALSVKETCMKTLSQEDRKEVRKCKKKCYKKVSKINRDDWQNPKRG